MMWIVKLKSLLIAKEFKRKKQNFPQNTRQEHGVVSAVRKIKEKLKEISVRDW